MIKKLQDGGLILDAKHRSDGKAEINGRPVAWKAGYVITYIPFESTRVIKRIVDPASVNTVEEALEAVHWGSLVSLELRGTNVISVTVEKDPLAEIE